MSMGRVFKYNEYREHNDIIHYTTITDDEVLEMVNISPKKTGVENVYMWFGHNPHFHDNRIKVSNIPNKFDKRKCFTITIPDLKVVGKVDNYINSKKMEQIKEFLELNMDIIIEFSNELISTDEFIDGLVKL